MIKRCIFMCNHHFSTSIPTDMGIS